LVQLTEPKMSLRGAKRRSSHVIARGRSPRGNLVHQCKIPSG